MKSSASIHPSSDGKMIAVRNSDKDKVEIIDTDTGQR